MPRYDDLRMSAPLANVESQIIDLVVSLKQELQLEGTFDDVIFGEEIALTPGAQVMLLIPILEARALGDVASSDTLTVRSSVGQLVEAAKSSPADIEDSPDALTLVDQNGREWPARASLSVVKSFWARFCNIPPFCRARG